MAERVLVVMDGDESNDWCELFSGRKLADGTVLHVVQAPWIETTTTVYCDSGTYMSLSPVRESHQAVRRPCMMTVKPSFVLVRNQARGPTPHSDRRNAVYGLMMGRVPSMNSLRSICANFERAVMYAALVEVRERLGHERFPLIDQNYYSSPEQMIVAFEKFPIVVKVSHAHAGMGKAKVASHEAFRDLSTVLTLHGDYCVAEPFVEVEYGIRVQKIGAAHYRAYHATMTGGGWKTQFGGAMLVEVPVTEAYKLWVDEASYTELLGHMDLCAVDAVHGSDGKDYIIELNGSAIGVNDWLEDSKVIRELVLQRMNELYCPDVATGTHAVAESDCGDELGRMEDNGGHEGERAKEKRSKDRELRLEENVRKGKRKVQGGNTVNRAFLLYNFVLSILLVLLLFAYGHSPLRFLHKGGNRT